MINAREEIRLRLTKEQYLRARRCASHLGQSLTSFVRIIVVERMDKLDEERHQRELQKKKRARAEFVPTVESEWDSPKRKGIEEIAVPVAGDAAEDAE